MICITLIGFFYRISFGAKFESYDVLCYILGSFYATNFMILCRLGHLNLSNAHELSVADFHAVFTPENLSDVPQRRAFSSYIFMPYDPEQYLTSDSKSLYHTILETMVFA